MSKRPDCEGFGPRRQSARSPRRPLPRAHTPLLDPDLALGVVSLACSWPLRRETIVLPLDSHHSGQVIVIVDGAASAAEVLTVADTLMPSYTSAHAAIVLASVRPAPDLGVVAADLAAWAELEVRYARASLTLLDWFVLSEHGIDSMADIAGVWRWRSPAP